MATLIYTVIRLYRKQNRQYYMFEYAGISKYELQN